MAHQDVTNKITMTVTKVIENGVKILVLKDMNGNEKFKKVGYNDWQKV